MPFVLGTAGAGCRAAHDLHQRGQPLQPVRRRRDRVQYRNVETGGRSFNQDVDTFAFAAASKARSTWASKFVRLGRQLHLRRPNQPTTTFGLFNINALQQGLGPSFVDAGDRSRDAARRRLALDRGLRAVNLLGGAGWLHAEMADFATFVAHDRVRLQRRHYYANITGDLFDLPARRARLRLRPASTAASPASTSRTRCPTRAPPRATSASHRRWFLPRRVLRRVQHPGPQGPRVRRDPRVLASRRVTRTTRTSATRPTASSASAGSRSTTCWSAATRPKASARRRSPNCSPASATLPDHAPTRAPCKFAQPDAPTAARRRCVARRRARPVATSRPTRRSA